MSNPRLLRTLIVVSGLVTAIVHLWLVYNGLTRPRNPGLSYPFLANGVGFLALVAAFLLVRPVRWNRIVQYLLMAFSAGSIIAWIVVNQGRFLLTLSIFDKAVEVLLIVVLWLHLRAMQPERANDRTLVGGRA